MSEYLGYPVGVLITMKVDPAFHSRVRALMDRLNLPYFTMDVSVLKDARVLAQLSDAPQAADRTRGLVRDAVGEDLQTAMEDVLRQLETANPEDMENWSKQSSLPPPELLVSWVGVGRGDDRLRLLDFNILERGLGFLRDKVEKRIDKLAVDDILVDPIERYATPSTTARLRASGGTPRSTPRPRVAESATVDRGSGALAGGGPVCRWRRRARWCSDPLVRR